MTAPSASNCAACGPPAARAAVDVLCQTCHSILADDLPKRAYQEGRCSRCLHEDYVFYTRHTSLFIICKLCGTRENITCITFHEYLFDYYDKHYQSPPPYLSILRGEKCEFGCGHYLYATNIVCKSCFARADAALVDLEASRPCVRIGPRSVCDVCYHVYDSLAAHGLCPICGLLNGPAMEYATPEMRCQCKGR